MIQELWRPSARRKGPPWPVVNFEPGRRLLAGRGNSSRQPHAQRYAWGRFAGFHDSTRLKSGLRLNAAAASIRPGWREPSVPRVRGLIQQLCHASLWRARDYEETCMVYVENEESCMQPFRYGVPGDAASCSCLGNCWSP